MKIKFLAKVVVSIMMVLICSVNVAVKTENVGSSSSYLSTSSENISLPSYYDFEKGEVMSSYPTDLGFIELKNRIEESGKREEVVVAVLDTGIDADHFYFGDRILDGEGFNVFDKSNNTDDRVGHGTQVAGIIAESTPDFVKILPVKILNDNESGNDNGMIEGLEYALEYGAVVANVSVNGDVFSQDVQDAIDKVTEQGLIVVVSAGNDSSVTDTHFPAHVESAIVVSATDYYYDFSDFSNYGDTVDVSAPGESVVSTSINDTFRYSLSGTSFASPYVVAACTLMYIDNGSLTSTEMEQLIRLTSQDLGHVGKDDYYGHGMINMYGYTLEQDYYNYKFSDSNSLGSSRSSLYD